MHTDMTMQLPLIWMGLIALTGILYSLLDGSDLGVGILFPWIKTEHQRDQMLATLPSVWDGNEAWLALSGGGLLVAFPEAAATLVSALYLPWLLLLLALGLRWVAASRWGLFFSLGSWIAALMQGILLGALLQGLPMDNGFYVGGAFGWLTSFSLGCGIAAVAGYGLFGATWLTLKTKGELQARCFQLAKVLIGVLIILLGTLGLTAPLVHKAIALRWFALPNLMYLSPVPFYMVLGTLLLSVSLQLKRAFLAWLSTVVLFLLTYVGLMISLWPFVVPYEVTGWQAAASQASQSKSLTVMLFVLPVLTLYSVYRWRQTVSNRL